MSMTKLRLSPLGWVAALGLVIGVSWAASNVTAKQDELTVTEELFIKEQIREAYADYSIYLDGDGIQPRNEAEWAKRLFTKDGTFEAYSPDGVKFAEWRMNDTREGNITTVSGISLAAAGTAGSPRMPPGAEGKKIVGTHFPVNIKFDKVTATVVETRATALVLRATRSENGDKCPYCESRPVNTNIGVYHDIWHKTPQGWKKFRSIEYLKT